MSTQTNLLYLGLVNVTMITGTHCSLSTVVRCVSEVRIVDFRLELRYNEIYDLYQLSIIYAIMAVSKCSNLPIYQLRSHQS